MTTKLTDEDLVAEALAEIVEIRPTLIFAMRRDDFAKLALTLEERNQISADTTSEYLGKIAEYRRRSLPRTVLDLARQCSIIADGRYDSLIERLGEDEAESRPTRSAFDRPHFDTATGVLAFAGSQISFRMQLTATAPVQILTAFQLQGWPAVIASPFPPDGSLSTTIYRLNERTAGVVRFAVQGGARQITWHVVKPVSE